MAFSVNNTAYNQLIALAECGELRMARIGQLVVYFVNEQSTGKLEPIGISAAPAGSAVLAQLARNKTFDASGYPLTFTAKEVSEAIEKAGHNERGNYLLVGSVATNTPELPYTAETQRDVDARKLMLR